MRKKADEPPQPAEDQVELSLSARRQLAEATEKSLRAEERSDQLEVSGRSESSKMETDSPTKAKSLDDVRQRIESGYYEQAALKDAIADKLADDLDKKQ